MRRMFLVAVAGCGFRMGAASSAVDDAPSPADASRVDSSIDARLADARPIDARPIDAALIPVRFVQGGSANVTGNAVSVQLASNEAAGDLNVIGVSWANTGVTVSSVTDTDMNSYTAIGTPIVLSGNGVLALYYAANVHQGVSKNTVTVTMSGTTSPIAMVAEYSGLALANPLDASASSKGTSGTALDSGAATTANAHDLLVGVAAAGASVTAGSGFTLRVGANLDLIEDREVTATGSYDATATLSSSNGWTMAVAAFKALN